MSSEAHRLPELAPVRVELQRRADGGIEMAHPGPLDAHESHLGRYLERHARSTPERVFFGAPDASGSISTLTYAEAKRAVDALSQALLGLGLSSERALVIIAENSIPFALLKLAAMQVGIPIAPISTAYAKHAAGRDKLAYLLDLLRPGAIALDDSLRPSDLACAPGTHIIELPGAIQNLARTIPAAAMRERFEAVRPDDVAKILFTSGSTGMPKGVLTTHRMLVSNIVAMGQVCPFIRRAPVIVDWLPWNHCFGGNFNFDIALVNGGSLYIDSSRPVEGELDATLLEAVPPTLYLNVPIGYERLCAHLEASPAFAERFFSRLEAMFYAGSTMPKPLWDRLVAVSRHTLGHETLIFTSYGSTESTPAHTMAHWWTDGPSQIGVPLPGSQVKLLPIEGSDRYEIRSKGPNITPGYFREPARTVALFDAEGWMITDDAVSFVDAGRPERGLRFHGRIAGNFKLLTGTWVPLDEIRIAAIANGAGLIRDCIVTGHDRSQIGLLVFVDPIEADRSHLQRAAIRARIAAALRGYNREHPSSSRRIGRFMLLDEPPEEYERELTDKGYLNQSQARAKRAALVEALYAKPPGAEVELLE